MGVGFRKFVPAALLWTVVGCSSPSLDGTWSQETAQREISVTFSPDGTGIVRIDGQESPLTYRPEADRADAAAFAVTFERPLSICDAVRGRVYLLEGESLVLEPEAPNCPDSTQWVLHMVPSR